MTRIHIVLLILVFILGCAKSDSTPTDAVAPAAPRPATAHNPTEDGSDLTPLSPNVIYAIEWNEVDITANSAITQVGIGAHFSTSRNACGREAYGPLKLEVWNNFATQLNAALKAGPRIVDFCVAIPDDDIYFQRTGLTVDVKTDHGVKPLYELRDGQICSKIKSATISNALLKAIRDVIIAADKEECPNGWGS